jgi:hypothetical protein
MQTHKIFASDRRCKALTGLSAAEFEALLPAFAQALTAYRLQLRPDRRRAVGGGRKGDLPTVADKLAFVLLYLKIYPTYDVMGMLTDRQRTKCCDSVKLLLPVLEMALGRKLALPQRKITSVEEFFARCPDVKDVFLDGTERRVQKPKNLKKRKRLYSGKQKATTRKSLVLSTDKRRILVLTPAKSGRRHDKRIADKYQLPEHIPEDVTIWTDTGFQGIQHRHPNTVMPVKATKTRPLTDAQKADNRLIAGIRVLSEHAIGGLKRMRAATDVYRNRLPNLDDAFLLLSAGLWNFHLQQTT